MLISFLLDYATAGLPVPGPLGSFWSNPVLALTFFDGNAIPIIAMVGGMLLGGTVAICALYFHHQKQKLWHDTARIALERGQPVPPMPLRDEELVLRPPPGVDYAVWHRARMAESRASDFKGGLILVGVGFGLYLMLPDGLRMIGAIPGFIGVALLLNALIQRFSSSGRSESDPRPPQA